MDGLTVTAPAGASQATSTGAAPLVLVAHSAAHRPPTASLLHLAHWLAGSAVPASLIWWDPGPYTAEPFGDLRVFDAAAAKASPMATRLTARGLGIAGAAVRGRAVRAALAPLAGPAVVYLSTGFAGAALRCLPAGERAVLTHVHEFDIERAHDLLDADRERLLQATDRWLASSDDVRAWLSATWGVPAEAIGVVAPAVAVDAGAQRRRRARAFLGIDDRDPVLALVGPPAGRGVDHGGLLVRRVLALLGDAGRQGPASISGRRLHVLWTGWSSEPGAAWPLEHDLRRLGDAFDVQARDPLASLDAADVVALTAADEGHTSSVYEAASRGAPVVCFATQAAAPLVEAGAGAVVPYPDTDAAAAEVVGLLADEHRRANVAAAATALARRHDVSVIGPALLALAETTPRRLVASPSGGVVHRAARLVGR